MTPDVILTMALGLLTEGTKLFNSILTQARKREEMNDTDYAKWLEKRDAILSQVHHTIEPDPVITSENDPED